jgi:hypothetical protein
VSLYSRSDKGKATSRRYKKTTKGKAAERRYKTGDARRAAVQRENASRAGRIRKERYRDSHDRVVLRIAGQTLFDRTLPKGTGHVLRAMIEEKKATLA